MQTFQWKFFRSGGVDQVHLTRGEELVRLGELDQKLWVALACPTQGVEFDARTLEFLDADHDRRVRASELIAAARWVGQVLSEVEELARRSDVLPLSAIATSNDEGALLKKTARELLESLGKHDATAISLQDTVDAIAHFDQQAANGDGVVPPSASSDPDVQSLIADIVRCTPDAPVDRSSEPGVDRESVETFFTSLTERLRWIDEGRSEDVLSLGDATPGAFRALEAVREKIDDYFARARLAAYDERAAAVVNRTQDAYLEATREALTAGADALIDFPLARVEPGRPLPLVEGINPAWTDALHTFRRLAVEPLFGDLDTLSDTEWSELKARLTPMRNWKSAEPATHLGALSEQRLREISEGEGRAQLEALLAADEARAPQANAIARVEKLIRFNAHLLDLANNFVAFQTFYRRQGPAIFQVGTLYIDRRACDLCVHVSHADRHIKLAGHSNAYLLYCDLRNARGETMSIAAAITDGDVDNLMVGRNGVFYDRDGNDWDATVTRIVDNPISIRQAFWSPYKKALRLLESQLTKRAQAAEAKSTKKLEAGVASADAATSQPSSAPTGTGAAAGTDQPSPPKMDLGTLAAIGVGVGGLTAALSLFLGAFLGLGVWMPLGIIGLILLISGPSMFIAWLKLRTRNLGPLLDANGWAVNAMARVNVPLGRSLTGVATLPRGASRELRDPFAEPRSHWPRYLLIATALILAVLWWTGRFDAWLPEPAHREVILAPAPALPSDAPADASPQAP